MAAESSSTKVPETAAALDFSALRVLVVDDNAINRRVAQQLLKRLGVTRIVTAEDGQEAVNAVQDDMDRNGEGFDFILMDLHMPVWERTCLCALFFFVLKASFCVRILCSLEFGFFY